MSFLTWRISAAALLLAGAMAVPAGAGDLVYTPINPAFGGQPFNHNFLVGTAQIQNQFNESGGGGGGGGAPVINFPPIDIDLGGLGGGGDGAGGGTPPIIVIPLPSASGG